MKKDLETKTKTLRKKGYSVMELHQKIGVSKSTISRWIQDVPLSASAQARLNGRYTFGQQRAQEAIKAKTQKKIQEANIYGSTVVSKCNFDKNIIAVLCSMIYFCEGSKSLGWVAFTNSDPNLIKLFMVFLRQSFKIDESKLRVLMQLHPYHNETVQRGFWSQITGIPKEKFHRSYLKKTNGIYKKEGYQGCIAVHYYDASLARKLSVIAKTLMERYK